MKGSKRLQPVHHLLHSSDTRHEYRMGRSKFAPVPFQEGLCYSMSAVANTAMPSPDEAAIMALI
jgi:hypothetical protein